CDFRAPRVHSSAAARAYLERLGLLAIVFCKHVVLAPQRKKEKCGARAPRVHSFRGRACISRTLYAFDHHLPQARRAWPTAKKEKCGARSPGVQFFRAPRVHRFPRVGPALSAG
ncbi:MAG: hypothetical protein ACK42L_02075, partial [Thermoanaerobaculum sp.]